MDRKPRADSKLDGLPGGRFLELRERMPGNQETYREIREWLRDECGVDTSGPALTAFFKRHCAPLLLERRALAAAQAEAIGTEASENPVDWDAAAVEKLRQFAFQMMLAPGADPKAVKNVFTILLKRQSLDHEGRKLALLEEKSAEAKRKITEALDASKTKGGLTEETLKRIEEAANLL
jgi:hypothetical protein